MNTLYNKEKDTLKSEGKNILYDKDFLSFVNYIRLTKWYLNLIMYCEKNNKDCDEIFENFCIIRKLNVGYKTYFVPSLISKFDVEKNTKKWKLYKKVIKDKIKKINERVI